MVVEAPCLPAVGRDGGLAFTVLVDWYGKCTTFRPLSAIGMGHFGGSEMAIPHAKPGDVIDVRPLGAALATTKYQGGHFLLQWEVMARRLPQ